MTVVTLQELDTKPKATPPPPTKLEPAAVKPSPAFIPKPVIEIPSPGPRQLAVDVPPPAVQIPVAMAPVVEPSGVTSPSTQAQASVRDAGDLSGTVLVAKPPVYPTEARRRHEQGTVKLLVLVDPDGRVADIEVALSSGSSLLDRAALHAVKRWRWTPAKQNGNPSAVRGYVTIEFAPAAQPETAAI